MKDSTKNELEGIAYVGGATLDVVVMYKLADVMAGHCEKLGDAALSIPYYMGMGLTEIFLGAVGLAFLVKAYTCFRDAFSQNTVIEELQRDSIKPIDIEDILE